MLKVGIDGCQNQGNGNWDKNKSIFYFLLSVHPAHRLKMSTNLPAKKQEGDKPA